MESIENQTGDITYILTREDDLKLLPVEIRAGVSPEVVCALADPIEYFGAIEKATRKNSFRRFLKHFLQTGTWSLHVAEMFLGECRIMSAYQWIDQRGNAIYMEPGECLSDQPAFDEINRYVRAINWCGLGCAGAITAADERPTIREFGFQCHNPAFPEDTTVLYGSSPCGDAMMYNPDGMAGYLSHDSFDAYLFGPLSDMLDWIFYQLADGEWPEFDWSRVERSG